MSDRPHILILMPDQQRADAMGCAGNGVIRTPNMDRLASEGVLFRRATTPSPLCMPARAAFISGTFPHQHHMWTNSGSADGKLPGSDATFFHSLQRAGYRTAHVGKSHYYPHASGDHLKNHEPYMHARGFDYVHETTGPHATKQCDSYMTDRWAELGLLDEFRADYASRDAITVRPSTLPVEEFFDSSVGREAVRFVEEHDEDRPTCMFVGFPGPHEPWDAPGEYAVLYDPADMPPPVVPEKDGPWIRRSVREKIADGKRSDLTPEVVAAIRANYYGKITLIDHWIGRILDAYERRGWLDDTLVFFWSDHGEMAGDHDRLHKQVFHHGSLDVPFIVRWPASLHRGTVKRRWHVCEGAVSDALVQPTDIYPTILELVGEEAPQRVAGASLWPVLRHPAASLRHEVFSEVAYRKEQRTLMVQTERYKYVMDGDGEGLHLYHELEDPDETRNLVGHPDYRRVETEMRDRILRFLVGNQEVLT